MTSKTWIGGHAGNDAGSAANWTPAGAPHHGDNLNVTTGTLEIGPRDLANNVLHLNDAAISGGPVTLDLNNARVGLDGSLFFGDPLTINATGRDSLDAVGQNSLDGSSGVGAIIGMINLADHAHLVVTGSMHFDYAGSLTGGVGAKLTNNGTVYLGLMAAGGGRVSVPVNGDGTLVFFVGHGLASGARDISAPVAAGQTVELDPSDGGITLSLSDPGDFHALLKIDRGDSVVVKGVHADGFSVHGNNVMLTNGGKPVDLLRVADAGSLQITASDGAAGTTLQFLVPH